MKTAQQHIQDTMDLLNRTGYCSNWARCWGDSRQYIESNWERIPNSYNRVSPCGLFTSEVKETGVIGLHHAERYYDIRSSFKESIDLMTMQGLPTYDLDVTNKFFDKAYAYLLKSSTWEEVSIDQNDWDSVSVFVNSNNSLRIVLIADALVRFNLLK